MANNSQDLLRKLLEAKASGAPMANANEEDLTAVQQEDLSPSNPPEQPPISQQIPMQPSSQSLAFSMRGPAGVSPRSREIRNDVEQSAYDLMKQREQDVAHARELAQAEENKSALSRMDLSPLMQLAAVAGADPRTMSMYKAPEDKRAELRAALEKSQSGLATEQSSFLKNQLEKQNAASIRNSLMQQRMNENIYGKVISGLTNNKQLNEMIEKSNNITRTADVAFAPGVDINTASLHDLQQTVTGALTGLKGTGGVEERAQRYMHDLNTDWAALVQKYGNDTNTIPRDEPILVHYMKLAGDGQKFLQEQGEKKIKQLASGHENVTGQPVYKEQLKNYIEETKGSFIKPQYMNTAISNAEMRHPSKTPNAVAKPKYTSEDIDNMSIQQLKDAGLL